MDISKYENILNLVNKTLGDNADLISYLIAEKGKLEKENLELRNKIKELVDRYEGEVAERNKKEVMEAIQ